MSATFNISDNKMLAPGSPTGKVLVNRLNVMGPTGNKSKVTMADLAAQLKVHPSTISLGLSGSRRVSESVRLQIRNLADEMGYSINHIARSLRQQSSKTLGAIFPFASSPFYATLLDKLYAQTLSRGFHLEVSFHQWSLEKEKTVLRRMMERQVEGLILLPSSPDVIRTLEELAPSLGEVPIAILSHRPERFLKSIRGCVCTDMQAGSRELGEYLISMGHRRIALLSPECAPPAIRELGLREVLDAHPDAELQVIYFGDDYSLSIGDEFEQARIVAERFLKRSPFATAVVASNEIMAHVLMDILHRKGIRIPQDISIACYDGTFLSAYGMLPLTCVAQPLDEIACNLVDLIIEKQPEKGERRRNPGIRILKPILIKRQSVVSTFPSKENKKQLE